MGAVGGGRESGSRSESKGRGDKIGLPQNNFAFWVVTSQQFCRRLWLYLFLDLSCIADKIVRASHLERYVECKSGRRDGFGVNLLFRFEKNISYIECEQDNILNLRSRFIASWSGPRWNIAVSVERLNSCKTRAWNDKSKELILNTLFNWAKKVWPKHANCHVRRF